MLSKFVFEAENQERVRACTRRRIIPWPEHPMGEAPGTVSPDLDAKASLSIAGTRSASRTQRYLVGRSSTVCQDV